jgi:hypothetical protein
MKSAEEAALVDCVPRLVSQSICKKKTNSRYVCCRPKRIKKFRLVYFRNCKTSSLDIKAAGKFISIFPSRKAILWGGRVGRRRSLKKLGILIKRDKRTGETLSHWFAFSRCRGMRVGERESTYRLIEASQHTFESWRFSLVGECRGPLGLERLYSSRFRFKQLHKIILAARMCILGIHADAERNTGL